LAEATRVLLLKPGEDNILLTSTAGELGATGSPEADLIEQDPDGPTSARIDRADAIETLFDYAYWRENLAGFTALEKADDGTSGPMANPDEDEFFNYAEALLGTPPLLSNGNPLVVLPPAAEGDPLLALYPQSTLIRDGQLSLQTTGDLGNIPWAAVNQASLQAGSAVSGDGAARWTAYRLPATVVPSALFFTLKTTSP
jgi:hypothetical protein